MDHDHSGHDMPGMDPMEPMCAMNMIWNTQIIDTCIVFPQWHIRSTGGFVVSFFVIVALGVFYEWLRAFQSAVDRRIALGLVQGKGKARLSGSGRSSPEPNSGNEEAGLLSGRRIKKPAGAKIPPVPRFLRATLYAATVFLSFFLMLVFMTYNAYLILAVVLGAGAGHYVFGSHLNVDAILSGGGGGKGMACH